MSMHMSWFILSDENKEALMSWFFSSDENKEAVLLINKPMPKYHVNSLEN